MKKAFKIVFYVQEQKGVCQPRGQAGPGHYGETGRRLGVTSCYSVAFAQKYSVISPLDFPQRSPSK